MQHETTTPLSLSSKITRGNQFSKKSAARITAPLPLSQKTMRGTDSLTSGGESSIQRCSPALSQMVSPEPPPFSGRNRVPENKNNTSLRFHISSHSSRYMEIVYGYASKTATRCIFIGIFLFMVLSLIMNAMMQVIAPFMNLICIISVSSLRLSHS